MSIDIHISNYEEYLYSYVDGELNPEEAAALEAFVAAHPQVRAELDLLLGTKLPATGPVFDAKASLYRQAAAPERNYQTVLLEYIDGELAPAEVQALEAFMDEHPALRAELAVWQKTRLQPDTAVSFGDKSILYRHTQKQRVVRMDRRYWWAAAAVLAGSLFLLRNTFRQDEPASAVPRPMAVTQPAAPSAQPDATPAIPQVAEAIRPAAENAGTLTSTNVPSRSVTVAVKDRPATAAPEKSVAAADQPETASPTSGNLLALNTIDRPAAQPDVPVVSAGISGAPAGIREPAPAPAKASIDVQHTASLATAAPAEPPGELIMSVTGNGIESKVLDKVTNVARIFAKKRNNR